MDYFTRWFHILVLEDHKCLRVLKNTNCKIFDKKTTLYYRRDASSNEIFLSSLRYGVK